jgi:XTP/dITP diphosphohydrolase
MELVIASRNSQKVLEIKNILKTLCPKIILLSFFDFPSFCPNQTKGASFEEDSRLKASHAAAILKKVCLADASGIIVPALAKQGSQALCPYQNGKDSASQQTKKLLDDMKALKEFERSAYLECSLAVASPSGLLKSATGRCEGMITEQERGRITFAFDTIFMKYDYNQTLGELPPSIKERISHRRKALECLAPYIEKFLSR